MDKFVKFWPGIRENETTNQNARKKINYERQNKASGRITDQELGKNI